MGGIASRRKRKRHRYIQYLASVEVVGLFNHVQTNILILKKDDWIRSVFHITQRLVLVFFQTIPTILGTILESPAEPSQPWQWGEPDDERSLEDFLKVAL